MLYVNTKDGETVTMNNPVWYHVGITAAISLN